MINVFEEKEKLTNELSDQYAKSLINLEEFESMIVEINKVESIKELNAVRQIVNENNKLIGIGETENKPVNKVYKEAVIIPGKFKKQKYETVFSSREIVAESVNGHAGLFSCVFSRNKIKIDDLPQGKTVLEIDSVFSLTEIVVPKEIKIVNKLSPVFAGVSIPDDEYAGSYGDRPELHIKGEAIFGNVSVIRV